MGILSNIEKAVKAKPPKKKSKPKISTQSGGTSGDLTPSPSRIREIERTAPRTPVVPYKPVKSKKATKKSKAAQRKRLTAAKKHGKAQEKRDKALKKILQTKKLPIQLGGIKHTQPIREAVIKDLNERIRKNQLRLDRKTELDPKTQAKLRTRIQVDKGNKHRLVARRHLADVYFERKTLRENLEKLQGLQKRANKVSQQKSSPQKRQKLKRISQHAAHITAVSRGITQHSKKDTNKAKKQLAASQRANQRAVKAATEAQELIPAEPVFRSKEERRRYYHLISYVTLKVP